jgi:alkylhydroperoxidase/carboxymuconolactone decarboxylase family protein YurZ
MTVPAGPRRRYRILLRGECKHLLTGLSDGLLVESGRGWTCVLASVRDESELYGLLERFQEFALHVASLNELGGCVPGAEDDTIEKSGLDSRTHALVRLAALVAAGESQAFYDQAVATALDQGVTLAEIAGVLVALVPTAGPARLTAAEPAIQGAIDRVTAG